jgi:hypothetical protein
MILSRFSVFMISRQEYVFIILSVCFYSLSTFFAKSWKHDFRRQKLTQSNRGNLDFRVTDRRSDVITVKNYRLFFRLARSTAHGRNLVLPQISRARHASHASLDIFPVILTGRFLRYAIPFARVATNPPCDPTCLANPTARIQATSTFSRNKVVPHADRRVTPPAHIADLADLDPTHPREDPALHPREDPALHPREDPTCERRRCHGSRRQPPTAAS